MLYKVVELAAVTDHELEDTLNRFCHDGWDFYDVRFVVREGVRRPSMAFVIFTRTDQEWEGADGQLDDNTDPAARYLEHALPEISDAAMDDMRPMAAPYTNPSPAEQNPDEVMFEPDELESVTLGQEEEGSDGAP